MSLKLLKDVVIHFTVNVLRNISSAILFLAFPRLDITGRRFHEDNHIIHSPALRLQAEFPPLYDRIVRADTRGLHSRMCDSVQASSGTKSRQI